MGFALGNEVCLKRDGGSAHSLRVNEGSLAHHYGEQAHSTTRKTRRIGGGEAPRRAHGVYPEQNQRVRLRFDSAHHLSNHLEQCRKTRNTLFQTPP
jgi:hypothetical protein